jgi:hypothetical protein
MGRRRRKSYSGDDFLGALESPAREFMKGQRKRPQTRSGGPAGCVTGLTINAILFYLLWRLTAGLD